MKENPISDTTAFLMIFTVLTMEGIQAMIGWIPFLGNILADGISFFIFLTFFIWFKMHGISMIKPKIMTALIGGGLVEMLPFINIFPVWTGIVIYLIGTTKVKELFDKNPKKAKLAIDMAEKINQMNRKREEEEAYREMQDAEKAF